MATQQKEWRTEYRQLTREERQFYYPLIMAGLGFFGGLLVGLLFFNDSSERASYIINVYTTLLGTVFTIGVIDRLNGRRARQQLKAQLIRELGASDNGIAARAGRELRAHGWLYDGSLAHAELDEANLEGAKLENANLRYVSLFRANLKAAKLSKANLRETELSQANLRNADLWQASLRGALATGITLSAANLSDANVQDAELSYAGLQDAVLLGANLKGAILSNADLQGAVLGADDPGAQPYYVDFALIYRGEVEVKHERPPDAHFDDSTVLPDGTLWSPDTDMKRFTDPAHPDFWRSADPQSPAYHDKKRGNIDDAAQ
jgi:uncharacterized protein YjbI with pentapeptide repeats